MAGTAKAYDSSLTAHGPTDIWLDVAVPSAGAEMTLYTDGTPDATANPSARHVGMLKTGAECSINAEIQEKTSDNLTTPYDVTLLTTQALIKGDWLQLLDTQLIAKLALGATRTAPSGKEKVTFGSLSAVAYTVAAAIWATSADATKFVVFQLYKCYNKAGWKAALNRKEDAAGDLELTGVAVTSRATADQVAALWKMV